MIKKIKKINSNFEISDFVFKENIKKNGNFKNSLAIFLNFGYYFITPLLLGIFFGYILDNNFKTKFFIKIFLFLGAISTFFCLYKITKEVK